MTQTQAAEEEVQELNVVTQEPSFLKLIIEAATQTEVTKMYEESIQTEVAEAIETQEVAT